MATDAQIEEWLMQGYGYRKTTELRGELIFENHQIVRDTLHTEEVYVRDLVQPANPMNDEPDEYADEYDYAEPGSACREASCGYCGRCT